MTGPEVIKLFSHSTQLSMKFYLLMESKILKNEFKLSDVVFILLINVKMPTNDGILTLMSRINFMLGLVNTKKFYNLEARYHCLHVKRVILQKYYKYQMSIGCLAFHQGLYYFRL